MRAPSRYGVRILAALLLAATSVAASAADSSSSVGTPLMYGLTGDPLTEQSLLATRWAPPALTFRLDTAAGFGAHELRILSLGSPIRLAPSQLSLAGSHDSLPRWNVEPVRATYRYTLLADPHWALKLGLSTNLRGRGGLNPDTADSQAFGALPMLHVAGIGQWSQRWRLAFALDGLMTARGRAVDLGVQVNYLWSPSMSLYGGYQVTDAAGEAEGYFGNGLNNRANIGLRFRF
jgi:lysozyme family protein